VAAAPATTSTEPGSADSSKPGKGHGDKNHDHTGPPGAKDSDQKGSDNKDSEHKDSDHKDSDKKESGKKK
jgi:hypothetical protein